MLSRRVVSTKVGHCVRSQQEGCIITPVEPMRVCRFCAHISSWHLFMISSFTQSLRTPWRRPAACLQTLATAAAVFLATSCAWGDTRTWDGKHDTSKIEVTVVYFLPRDRRPLADWRERVDYFCRRIEQFHAREFGTQSALKTVVHPEPLVSEATTAELRRGDGDAIFFKTLRETDARLKFAQGERTAYPILLVLSEINWRPLDDFYRLHPRDGQLVFEGNYNNGEHFPGAASGGARATYLADRGVGWGLVSADGWRVPYRGSDCVVYHEGVGHTVGLPHPEPGNGSVMSLGQYQGWISESWLDKEQKSRMKWQPEKADESPQIQLFSHFRALPKPPVPQPGEAVSLALDWPAKAEVKSLRVRYQTSVDGPWIDVPQRWEGAAPAKAELGKFDRATPISYRVDAELKSGATAELWGYFQVRQKPSENPQPLSLSPDLIVPAVADAATTAIDKLPKEEIDLLEMADPKTLWTSGEWTKTDGKLVGPKQFGARLELPYSPPAEYRLVLVVEPLDEPNGLILGNRVGERRFVTLFNYKPNEAGLSAIEDIDGKNIGNETTFQGNLFKKGRTSQVIVTVLAKRITMSVDGRTIVDWSGTADHLSLSEYWKTPGDSALFLGCYDCRYRFHRITLEPITGTGKKLAKQP